MRRPDFQRLLSSTPELVDDEGPGVHYSRLEFDDDTVASAVAGATSEWRLAYEDKSWPGPADCGVEAADLAAVLAGIPGDNDAARRRVSHSDRIRVGQEARCYRTVCD